MISDLKRWDRIAGKESQLPADCFFDIKTNKNTLSLWKVDNTNDRDALYQFAVISVLGKNSLSKVTYVLIDENELTDCGLKFQQDDPYCGYIDNSKSSFLKHHFDIMDIDHEDFIKIASIIVSKIENNKQDIISIKDVNSVAKRLCDDGIVIKERLQKSMQDHLNKKRFIKT